MGAEVGEGGGKKEENSIFYFGAHVENVAEGEDKYFFCWGGDSEKNANCYGKKYEVEEGIEEHKKTRQN